MRLLDPNHPFFDAAWRRWACIIVPFAWAGVEAHAGNTAWAYLFAAIGGYLAYQLLYLRGR